MRWEEEEGEGVRWAEPATGVKPSKELREWLDMAEGEIQLAAEGD
jgi:hypothetical protein